MEQIKNLQKTMRINKTFFILLLITPHFVVGMKKREKLKNISSGNTKSNNFKPEEDIILSTGDNETKRMNITIEDYLKYLREKDGKLSTFLGKISDPPANDTDPDNVKASNSGMCIGCIITGTCYYCLYLLAGWLSK